MNVRRTQRELGRRLRGTVVPGESEARDRAWRVVRAAWGDRPEPRPRPRGRRLVAALVVAGVILAVGLSPAGAKVGELIDEAFDSGTSDPRPGLTSLPAAGQLLVASEAGVWTVAQDGSQRLLGDYREASWSPRALFVAAADENQLTAVDPGGDVRWSLAQPRPVSDPRWAPSGYRVAYRSGNSLRVVGGDGVGDRAVASGAAQAAPAWRPLAAGAIERSPSGTGTHEVSFATAGGLIRSVDVDAPRELWRAKLAASGAARELAWLPAGGTGSDDLLAVLTADGVETFRPGGEPGFAWGSPSGSEATEMATSARGEVAVVRVAEDADGRPTSELVVVDSTSPARAERRLLAGPGRFSGLAFSPDGRWLAVAWKEAARWLFLPVGTGATESKTVAVEGVSAQFDPGTADAAELPQIEDWCCSAPPGGDR